VQAAISRDGVKSVAWKTEKSEGPFRCPGCTGEVILKKGKVKEHHYAHKPPYDCQYGAGETQVHYRCKREIFEALLARPECSDCDIEKQLNGVRPDVYAVISSARVAIVIQKTTVDLNDIERRSARYRMLGIYVLWIAVQDSPKMIWHEGEEEWACRPKEWEKYLHSMYFGRVYYWTGGLSVRPFHFDKFQIWVAESEWYDEDGEFRQEGGYYRDARALKRPMQYPVDTIDIVRDFSPQRRKVFNAANWSIPECNIWMDSLKPWWSKQTRSI
jgi:competence protein CoiA